MALAWYRKWRPQTWDEVVGQDQVIRTLRNAVRGDRVAHAYLFAGPRGTGKTTTARLLAKAVNCEAESLADRPCDQCKTCKAIREGRFLDLIEIDAASNTSVEDVRNLRDKINFTPNKGRYKVYIIDEVHMLSTAAFNALLKTLEEPPKHAIFILATTEVHRIPATVLSRCQRHEFRRLPVATISEFLIGKVDQEGMQVEPSVIDLIARQSTGSLRDAISLLDQLASTGEQVTLSQAQDVLGTAASEAVRLVVLAMVEHQSAEGLTLINQALDAGSDPRQFARQIVDYLHSLLLIQMENGNLIEAAPDVQAEMSEIANQLPLPQIISAIRGFNQAAQESRTTWFPSLPLEIAFLESIGETVHPGETIEVAARPASLSRNSTTPSPATTEKTSTDKSPSTAPVKERINPASNAARVNINPEAAGDIDLELIRSSWNEVLKEIRSQNPILQGLLNSCRLLGIESGALILGFESDILREKMMKEENLALVCKTLLHVLGKDINVRCALTRKWHTGNSTEEGDIAIKDGGMVETFIREYGAKVIKVKQIPPEDDSKV